MKVYGIEVNKSLRIISNGLTKCQQSRNFSNQICPDQYVAELKLSNNSLIFVKNNITNRRLRNNNNMHNVSLDVDYENIAKDYYIVLILESPHSDEFDKNGVPYGPACGSTGRNINRWIREILSKSPTFMSSLKSNDYKLVLINAVQYQASQSLVPLDRDIRDENWLNFWKGGFGTDLEMRLKKFKSSSLDCQIVNLCTLGNKGLHFYVNQALKNAGIPFFEGYHPSRNWQISSRRFIW